MYSMMFFIMIFICMLLSVAFFTLFERKILGYIHKRKGPNKSSLIGLTQPFSDALKLLSKEYMISSKMNYMIYSLSPMMMMILALMLWMIFPSNIMVWTFNQSIIFMLCCFSISVYPIMLGGWSSNSNYALIGSMRGLAQTISYEVSLSIILISCLMLFECLNFYLFNSLMKYVQLIYFMWPLFFMLFISSLAEVNRTPFDLVEGESELVSGFNIEYYGFGFAFIFLAEYSMILWISGLNSILFFTKMNFLFMTLFISFFMIWIRGTFPRMRYDELMYMCWKMFLPLSIMMLTMITMFKFYLISDF
uniref:NADH-ubiquinone oxidoreductase chain 1 n=1 Tax=Auplopus sp. SJW-2017 TaxID=1940101 RepID=A0A1P8VH98_9HYME|nr:NADH dehydrogenase subunit 1 [Auplopus sp. SJW-2017]